MLVRRLAGHPHVQSMDEVLNPVVLENRAATAKRRLWGRTRELNYRDLRSADIVAYLERMAWAPRHRRITTSGFKILWTHLLDLPSADRQRVLCVPNLKLILLERQNALAQFISQQTAQRDRRWSVAVGERRTEPEPISLSCASFEQYLAKYDRLASAIGHTTKEIAHHAVIYEKLVADPEGENARLCDFLGVDRYPLPEQLQKLATRPLRERIANFDAFALQMTIAGLGGHLDF